MQHKAYRMIILNVILGLVVIAPNVYAFAVPQKTTSDGIGIPIATVESKPFKKIKPKPHKTVKKISKIPDPTPTSSQPANTPPTASKAVTNCGDNQYKQFIYQHESGCRTDAVNGSGCIGIGQSCPGGSGLANDCPDWRTNFACSDAHFTRYANSRYGSWAGAYQAWLRQGWW